MNVFFRLFLILCVLGLSGCESTASTIYERILVDAKDFVLTLYAPLTAAFDPIAYQLQVVFLFIMGWGYISQKPKPWMMNIGILIFATSLVTTPFFIEWFYTPIIGTSKALAEWPFQIILNAKTGNVFVSMEDGMIKVFDYTAAAIEPYYPLESEFWVICLSFGVLLILSILQYVMFLSLLLLGLIGLHIIMVPAGVMFYLAATPITRHIFFAWFRMLLTYALIPFFAALVLAFSFKITQGALVGAVPAGVGKSFFTGELLYAATTMLLSIWLLSKAPEWAAGITGGQSTGMGGLFGMAVAGLATAAAASKASGAEGALKGAGKYGLSGAKGAIDGWRGAGEGANKPYSAMLGILEGVKETYSKGKR